MRSRRVLSAMGWFLVTVAAAGTAVAQSPFAGTWKLNQERSQLAGDTMKFGPAEGEAMELVAGGVTYSFRVDGKNYAMPSGEVAMWRQTSPDSWTTEYRTTNGKLMSSDSWKLSADDKNLSVTTSGVRANGDLYTDTAMYVRTEGAGGLTGSWKSTDVKLSSPSEFIIQESGLDALILKLPAMKASCRIIMDGREAAVDGPDLPPGLRLSITRTGPFSFRLVQKLNGSPVSSTVYTVSEDRTSMTGVGGSPGDAPATKVWEKQ